MRDEWFIRGKVPMTKSEVRTVSLSKLELYEDCEFWDIGAGTGSVSVEAAVSCPPDCSTVSVYGTLVTIKEAVL